MRRLVLLSSLATVGLGIATASAQYTYPPGGYRGADRGDGIMAPEPSDDGRYAPRAMPRSSSYDPPVESQPLPSLGGERDPAPYQAAPYGGPSQQAMPGDSLPPAQDRNYGRPAYGAAPSNEPYASNAYPGGNYPNSPYQGGPSYQAAPSYQGGPYSPPPGQYPGGQQYGSGGQYNQGAPYNPGEQYGSARPDAPRPPAAVDGYRPSYGAAPTNLAPGMNTAPGMAPGRGTAVASLPPEDQPEIGQPKELPPQFRRQVVDYKTKEPAGTIIIDTPSTFLYFVNGDGTAIRYGIGVGRDGFTWKGTERITRMAEWPDWHPPAEMIERQPYLPRFMAGGESNPLGARALYLGKTIYRVHGTNQPSTIGQFVSSGCIRMLNEDVQDLYTRVKVGTRVVVLGDGKGGPTASNTSATR
jgi:lipoprotein-anchoring transpeptidase ErfK/SrfK